MPDTRGTRPAGTRLFYIATEYNPASPVAVPAAAPGDTELTGFTELTLIQSLRVNPQPQEVYDDAVLADTGAVNKSEDKNATMSFERRRTAAGTKTLRGFAADGKKRQWVALLPDGTTESGVAVLMNGGEITLQSGQYRGRVGEAWRLDFDGHLVLGDPAP